LADQPAGCELLLVVDQFEEVFTRCVDAEQRSRFVAALLAAVHAPDSRARVVLGMRADAYPRCVELPGMAAALRDRCLPVGPMTAPGVWDAIVKPAQRAGLIVEVDLVATFVAEAAASPGALPFVSHALLECWQR